MRRSLLVLLAVAAFPSSAAAAPVLVLGHDGRVSARNDPFLSGSSLTPTPNRHPTAYRHAVNHRHAAKRPQDAVVAATAVAKKRPKPKPQPTLFSALARLQKTGALSPPAEQQYSRDYSHALTVEKHLKGARQAQLDSVTETIHQIAVSGQLTPSRLPALFATLAANVQWWTTGPLLASGQRVEFAGSQLVWEYYPGQGIQLQVLGSFGKANGLFTAGPANYKAMEQLLAELIPLAAQRGGGLTWEYYFNFDGGKPPWTSAMSQATGLEALSRAYQATGNPYYLTVAGEALPVFTVGPPAGVGVKTALGTRFLQYTFAPHVWIINAFLQTLIGLQAYARVSGNPEAQKLFNAGNAEATAEVPSFDTGAWSLYQPGVEDDLSYHELVTGFLQQLCTSTGAPVYCTTAQRFQSYLKIPPVLKQLTFKGRAQEPVTLSFQLSKISHVGVVLAQGATTKFETSATLPYGLDHFTVPALKHAGTYNVTLAATDLAGNFARIAGTLAVSPGPAPTKPKR
ncbi:MAG: D-glucuronyl C5-epimerase family protein [Solirubrobacteraceae bacterium]